MICQMICQSVHFGLNWPNLTIEKRNYNNLCQNRPTPRFETNRFSPHLSTASFLRISPLVFQKNPRLFSCSSIIVEAHEKSNEL